MPRRSQQQQQQPRQEIPKAFQSGGQQFQATPRFSLHSTPRGSAGGRPSSSFRTPVSASASASTKTGVGSGVRERTGAAVFFRPTQRTTDPINDIIDSSPPFAEQQRSSSSNALHDPIEHDDARLEIYEYHSDNDDKGDDDEYDELDAIPESSPPRASTARYGSEGEDYDDDLRDRAPKRRRISISSDWDVDELSHQHGGESGSVLSDLAIRDDDDGGQTDIDMIRSSPLDRRPGDHLSTEEDENKDEDEDEANDTLPKPPPPAAPQPIFQKAPRFKPAEASDSSHHHGSGGGDPLPDAFSPHRRGAKYAPGGLAAEVRDWFVDVWAGATTTATTTTSAATSSATTIGTRRDGGDWIARVIVDEVRGASGMMLVTGRYCVDGGDGDGYRGNGGSGRKEEVQVRSVRVVLAGSQRLSGLEKKQEVKAGAVIGVGRPTWEVSLQEQGRWGVVCEWAVLK